MGYDFKSSPKRGFFRTLHLVPRAQAIFVVAGVFSIRNGHINRLALAHWNPTIAETDILPSRPRQHLRTRRHESQQPYIDLSWRLLTVLGDALPPGKGADVERAPIIVGAGWL